MDLANAQQMALDVLIQERTAPALYYSQRGPVLPQIGNPAPTALIQRSQFYYAVQRRIEGLTFHSENFDLLSIIYGQLAATDQMRFARYLSEHLSREDAFGRLSVQILEEGKAKSSSSEAPLIAEFLTRQGHAGLLIQQLSSTPFTPALTHLLLQLRTILSWDFRRFSSAQLREISSAVGAVADRVNSTAKAELDQRIRDPRKKVTTDTVTNNTRTHVFAEVPEIAAVVVEQCREAGFLYLRDSLMEGANLEVNQDKIRVDDYLQRLGFPDELAASLNEAENTYKDAASGFNFKASMGHLRTFLENLHIEAGRKIHARSGGTFPARWGETHEYLQSHGLLSKQEKLFVIPFYTLLSDEGVHPFQTTRDYARLLRNICIEYGLLLLTKVEAWVQQNEAVTPTD